MVNRPVLIAGRVLVENDFFVGDLDLLKYYKAPGVSDAGDSVEIAMLGDFVNFDSMDLSADV